MIKSFVELEVDESSFMALGHWISEKNLVILIWIICVNGYSLTNYIWIQASTDCTYKWEILEEK